MGYCCIGLVVLALVSFFLVFRETKWPLLSVIDVGQPEGSSEPVVILQTFTENSSARTRSTSGS